MAHIQTLIELDEALVEQARVVLGTHTVADTVDCALQEVVRMDARRTFLAKLRAMDGLELDSEQVMRDAWR